MTSTKIISDEQLLCDRLFLGRWNTQTHSTHMIRLTHMTIESITDRGMIALVSSLVNQ